MRDRDELFAALQGSRFRRSIQLAPEDRRLLQRKSREVLQHHARRFVLDRLAPAQPRHDGRQTPWRGHPVFTAQHATATCCRKCLAKWHFIDAGHTLSHDQVDYVVQVILTWLDSASGVVHEVEATRQRFLFDPGDCDAR